MKSRNFRHLFKNFDHKILQAGFIWNRTWELYTTYAYIASSYEDNIYETDMRGTGLGDTIESLDLCVMGGYTACDIKNLLKILDEVKVKTVVLPYIIPIQRLFIARSIPLDLKEGKDILEFLNDPYEFLQKKKIPNIYFLYGNTVDVKLEPETLRAGHHFQEPDELILASIYEIEGKQIPVVNAGYILENEWLYYFGVFGSDLTTIQHFVKEHIKTHRYIVKTEDKETSYPQMDELLQEYEKKFGSDSYASIAMFHGPVKTTPKEKKSMMVGKIFSGAQRCDVGIPREGTACSLVCQHNYDHDVYQRYKNSEVNQTKMGIWLLGNVNLKKYYTETVIRFWHLRDRIRAISIPNGGDIEYWDNSIFCMFKEPDYVYWILPLQENTSQELLFEILSANAYNRLIRINKENGFCFSGFLIDSDTVE